MTPDRASSGPAPGFTAVPHKALLTLCVMLATVMQAVDSTIANVALPHIQSSLSATQDQANWVLTSYLVAAAVMYPLTGWLANRLGRRNVFLVSVTLFVAASALCGIATSLPELVFYRLLQGIGGAALAPLSQAILLAINPPKDYGRAMTLWGGGGIVGPMLGLPLGGWLTDSYSWRWVFYINVPIGLLTIAGLYLTLPKDRVSPATHFDFTGFATLGMAVASLQLMLDRGQTLDWFAAREIVIEAILAGLSFYLFLVHTLSHDKPFVSPALFRDRNFVVANLFLFLVCAVLFSTLALHPPLLQQGLHYPVVLTGWVIAPRILGALLGMVLGGRLVPRFDARLVMGIGLGLTAYGFWQMTHYSLEMGPSLVIVTGVVQGIGTGATLVCLSVVAFVTLPSSLRNEGTGIFNLVRSIGGAIGISVMGSLLIQNTQRLHAALAEHITPYNMTANPAAGAAHVDVLTTRGLMALNNLVTSQSTMMAYIDDFKLMMVLTLLTIPFLLLFKRQPS